MNWPKGVTYSDETWRRALAVWAGLRQVYPTFEAERGREPPWEWVQAIDQIDDSEAKAALLELARQPDSEKKHPADLSRFMAIVRRLKVAGDPGVVRPPSQPAPPRATSVRDYYLANMRARLGMKPKAEALQDDEPKPF